MRSLLQALLVAVAVAVVAVTLPAGTDASWVPIPARDLDSMVVQQVARFAVIVHNITRRTNLVFVSVVRGETERPEAGGGVTGYRLVLTAERAPGGIRGQYLCDVRGVPGSSSNPWKVLSFKAI